MIWLELKDVDPRFMKPLFSAQSAQFDNLAISKCYQLDMTAFIPCAQLTTLCIEYFSLNSDINPPAGLNSLNFLPNLDCFVADDCLKTWAPLIEGKRDKLKHLTLHCCHIGTNVGGVFSTL